MKGKKNNRKRQIFTALDGGGRQIFAAQIINDGWAGGQPDGMYIVEREREGEEEVEVGSAVVCTPPLALLSLLCSSEVLSISVLRFFSTFLDSC